MQVKCHMTKLIKFSSKFPLWKTLEVKFRFITVTKILKCSQTNWYSKWRGTFKTEKIAVLAEYFEQQTDCNRYKRRISQSRKSPLWGNQSYLSCLMKQMETTLWKPSRVGHVILRRTVEKYFQFHWNCKQLWVEARNSMPNFEIYFPILKIFSQYSQRKCR